MNVEHLARYEFKYAVRPDQLERLRTTIDTYCVPDGYYPPAKNGWYSVDTLYFDSPDWRIFRAAENQELVRTKLRVRAYPDSPGSVAKIEVKRRIKEQIAKTSTVVTGEGWQRWLNQTADCRQLPAGARQSLETFLTLQRSMDARPRILIRYQRQAFRGIYEDYVRVTFDREICYQPVERYDLEADSRGWRPIDDGASIGMAGHLLMELKFRLRPPVWMTDMVCRLGLVRQGFSKYCTAVRRQHRDWHALWDLVPGIRGGYAA